MKTTVSQTFYQQQIDTLLGPMIAISDENHLLFLKFIDQKLIEADIQKLLLEKKANIVHRNSGPNSLITSELDAYFAGTLRFFKTPIFFSGSSFQIQAWKALAEIPYGNTKTYKTQSISLGNAKGYRAVGNANRVNPLAIIIPCHRVIQHDGSLGGYAGGIFRKKWLIEHEKKEASND